LTILSETPECSRQIESLRGKKNDGGDQRMAIRSGTGRSELPKELSMTREVLDKFAPRAMLEMANMNNRTGDTANRTGDLVRVTSDSPFEIGI
jgi:hypothetical protein